MEIVDFSVAPSAIDGLVIVTPKQVSDERGTIRELFRRSAFRAAGVDLDTFDQINVTETRRGAVRGMHAEQMTKLVTVASGEAFGAYADLRPGSATRGAVVTVELRPGVQVLVPSGVANGFQALTDGCQYLYCFDTEWQPGMAGQACSPLGAGIEWPIAIDPDDPLQLSTKDRTAPLLADVVSEDS
ncbi:MAG: dTDP-4-dehydrorhamnose 3,5-epimerase family protein [Ilumatobacter sp.]|nr:dTDP-4-dehydrorhamnose 3,5-epimerase family protein [Ilumatobacter sp.]